MAANSGQTAQHLGYFGPFMKSWGQADEQTQADVHDVTLAYRAGEITADQEVRQVSTELAIPIPAGW